MGTVVITLLIITRFYVSKMDADSEERPRDRISRREKRWSMNSQRLEQIVAELMRPIGDLRRSFDTDLSALLEEYLTEAGLHALEAGERSPDGSPERGPGAAPNFPELALLLQQSANIYGRKVDFLYQHVLEVSESLQNSTNELSQSSGAEAEPATPNGSGRRKRRGSAAAAAAAAGWARIELAAAPGARRDPDPRPPPTLPRMYLELEPRVMAPGDAPLHDYHGEPVGLLHDFHVTWRLHGGLLVDELECGGAEAGGGLRAIPLAELQAAIEAAAPPPPPRLDPDPPDAHDAHDEADAPHDPHDAHDPRLVTSTPLPTECEEPPPPAPAEAPAPAPRRKRKPEPELYEHGAGKIYVTPELRVFLRQAREFSVSGAWVQRVVAARRARVLALRAALPHADTEFRGFDTAVDRSDISDIGGFPGFEWSACASSELALTLSRLSEAAGESDDDGFFEQSSLGSEGSARPEPASPPPPSPQPMAAELASSPEWFSWRAEVVARAAAGEARGLCVRALGQAVLDALPDQHDQHGATPFNTVLDAAAKDDADVSRLFLATLFLANAGNVEVVPGAPLSLNSFALRVVSRDERRYCAAADTDPAFLAR